MIARILDEEKNGRSIVSKYFKKVQTGDLKGLLNLFSDNSIIFEPFSKAKFLSGRLEIEPFLETMLLANKGMQNEIIIEREQNIENRVIALVTFHKGGSVTARYTFQLNYNGQERETTIKSLNIEFLS